MTDPKATPTAAAAAVAADAITKAKATTPAPATSSSASGITKKTSLYFADPKMIDPPEEGGINTRFDLGDIDALAAQIKNELMRNPSSGGLLRPLDVKREGDRFRVIDGRRRFTAITRLMKAGHEFPDGVPVQIIDRNASDQQLIVRMFVANEGKPFTPLEEAAAYGKLRDLGLTVKQIGEAVGRKHMHVSQILALLEADDSVKDAVKTGAIGKTQAKEIASAAKGNKELQKDLVDKAKAAGGKNTKNAAGRKAVKKAIDDAKVKRANAKGKELKPRMLDFDQVNATGQKLSKHLLVLLKEAGLPDDSTEAALEEMAAKDEKLAAIFTFGAMQGLKAACGLKVRLEL